MLEDQKNMMQDPKSQHIKRIYSRPNLRRFKFLLDLREPDVFWDQMKFIRIQHKKSSQFSGDQEDFRRPRTFLRKPRRFQETKEISEDQGDTKDRED